ncbi:MAG: TetR/AcrR family transcriptional regulator [Mycobacteriales bacterium]
MTTTAPRREQLLAAAADLFAARGFHDVGIDDIGAAAGITGPGVYRHFPSKQALLAVLCDRTMTRMLALAEAEEDLEALVALHVRFAVEERALLAVWVREQRSLEEDLRARQRSYEKVWRAKLAPLRPDLDADQVALTVGAVLAMLNTTALIDSPLPAAERATVLRRLALAALRSD